MPFPISKAASSVRALSQVEELFKTASQMRLSGHPFVSLMTGDIFLPSPPQANAEGIRAIESGACYYGPIAGDAELRAGIAKRLRDVHGLDYERDEVLVTPGGALGLYYACLVMKTDKPFFIPAPHWWSFPHQVRLAGGHHELLQPDPKSLKITPEILDEAMSATGGGTLIINHPVNPTGVVYTRNDLAGLADVLVKHDAYCISDETYSTMLYDGEFTSLVAAHSEMRERTVIGDSFSKAYNMTGWRIGYLCGPRDFISAAEMAQSVIALTPSSISQRAAIGALETPQDTLDANLEVHRQHRDMVLEMLGSIDGLECVNPASGIFAFPDVSSFFNTQIDGTSIDSSADMCLYLLRAHGLLTAPGCMFGSDKHIRLSFSVPHSDLEAGLTRLGDALRELRERGKRD